MKKTFEKWCVAFVSNLADHMNLSGWRFGFEFSDKSKGDSEGCWAEINSDHVYMQATLTTYPLLRESWEKGDTRRVVEVLTHELCHSLIDPLHVHALPYLSDATRPAFTDILENVVQRTAVIIQKGLPKNIIPPR